MNTFEKIDRRNFLFGLGSTGVALGAGLNLSNEGPIANASDYDVIGDGKTDVTKALQAALNQLTETGGILFIPTGRYIVSRSLEIRGDGITIMGEGIGSTIIQLKNGTDRNITGIIRTPANIVSKNILISDLTIDGNKANQKPGRRDQYGFYCGVTPDMPDTDEDITCLRVEIQNCAGYGFDPHEVVTRLRLIDCISHHNRLDGFTLDGCRDSIVRGCSSFSNGRHGFNLVTNSQQVLLTENYAHDNHKNGITVQNGSHGNQIIGNKIYYNMEDGIYLISVDDTMVTNNYIHDNQNYGIRLRGCPNSTVSSNRLGNNSQREHERYDEIHISDDGDRGSFQCMVANNHIAINGQVRARYCILELEGDGAAIQNENMFSTNKAFGSVRSSYHFNGRRTANIGNA